MLERPQSESPRSWDAYIQGLVASIGLTMAQQGARVAPVGVVVVSEPPRPEGASQRPLVTQGNRGRPPGARRLWQI